MTEVEWLTSEDPARMAATLGPVLSARRLRLYLCGGCRVLWPLLFSEMSCESVEVAERFADGEADAAALAYAHYAAEVPTFGYDLTPSHWRRWAPEDGSPPSSVRRLLAMGVLSEANLEADQEPADEAGWRRVQAAALLAELCSSASLSAATLAHDSFRRWVGLVAWPAGELMREIAGNPFRPAAWDGRWRTADVVGLARGIYEGRAFERLPLLADALMDAGCADEAPLGHCRSAGPHLRGCWVVDWVLGRE